LGSAAGGHAAGGTKATTSTQMTRQTIEEANSSCHTRPASCPRIRVRVRVRVRVDRRSLFTILRIVH